MTVPPIPFPTQFGGGAIMDPGSGAALAQGVANVLAQQQIQRENQFRMQQLQQQAAQQAALEQYYQGQISVQSREQASTEQQQALERQRLAQVGGVQARALGIGGPAAGPVTGTAPAPPNLGNQTQSMGGALPFRIGPGGTPSTGGALPMQIGGPPPAPGQGALSNPGPFQQVLQGGAQALGGQATLDSIFTGVSPENIPAAVQGAQEVQALQPKPEELPTSAKEFKVLQELKVADPSGQLASQYWDLIRKPPGTVVNVGGQPTPYSKAYDEASAKRIDESMDQAKQAFASFPALDEAYRIVASGKAITGPLAKPGLALTRVAALFGVPGAAAKAADTQTLLKLTGDQVLSYLRTRVLGSNNAVSDGDRLFMEGQAGRDLTQQPQALRKIMRINYGAGIVRQAEAIEDLKQSAIDYPERAAQAIREMNRIKKQQLFAWGTYTRMLKEEGETDEEVRARMLGAGVDDPESILKKYQGVGPDIKKLGDDIYGPARP